ncbi:MAG TPA: FKBP-type peptidyl-prolyl cis-trans isomerase [Aromatoleum sp.]|uniref:FKBP-type peptidyl-prolyl cis-trans isomerase n=1 Tax=Aromatoleum sp. TaxID=2307007 RepID=UPI002B470B75|nr:FKBP-type peptidyl-prolyl cis-trans isomerase [Aromatoleum sp.]HJV24788.1 FKBP-type peptidyl-prolyl cis-trans isomerase [Aromatoleum sp.]
MTQSVQPNSLVTLHYRIALENGQPLISTFEGTPATLQLGAGELLPSLERMLAGLPVGTRQEFTLAPEEAFGPYNPDLVEHVKREHMPDEEIEAMTIMEFGAPDGTRYSGLVREINDAFAVVDFNHPLAGKTIRFEVDIIGVV